MLRTWIHRIKPGKEDRLRQWLVELTARTEELRESFAASGVRAEQAFVLDGVAGGLLIYVSEAENHAHTAQAFADSIRPIDVEHRRVMDECIEVTLEGAPLYDAAMT